MSCSIRSMLSKNRGRIRLCEVHDRSSVEILKTTTGQDGQGFHGLWIGGLCQTTNLGIPDTELISPLHRAALMALNGNLQRRKSHHPICTAFDADSGGPVDDIPALVAVLALMGVSMIIIEDKAVHEPGQKVNSLKETSSSQTQADACVFADTIRAFKSASAQKDMMITARIESFILRKPQKDQLKEQASVQEALEDALFRAGIYREAGVDAIMIHSKSSQPDEVFSFLTQYRAKDATMPLVVVPTTYAETLRSDLYDAGANVIIYANHLMRAKISALESLSNTLTLKSSAVFREDPELSACLETRNYGYLLHKLNESRAYGEESFEAQKFRTVMETCASENMKAVVKDLLDGNLSGCEANERIIPVKDLLKINAHQIAVIEV